MSDERTEESEPRVSTNLPVSVAVSVSDGGRDIGAPARTDAGSDAPRSSGKSQQAGSGRDESSENDTSHNKERGAAPSKLSMARDRMQSRLPALDDDSDVGRHKEYIVTRDGKADLRFNGMLLASAAPPSAPEGHWEEYRIYQTDGDKHVFSKVTRNVLEKEEDAYEAEVFDPNPSSVPSQLMKSAREITHSRPLTWMDAAVKFFGYDPLAKALYRKLSVRFEEQIS